MKRSEALLLAALGIVTARAQSAAAAQKITITLPSLAPDEGPFLVADQKGYFNDEGLTVEFVTAGGGIATPGLLSGSVDGSASPSSALTAILRGAPLRVVLVFEGSPSYEIWGAPQIRTLADLKGKSIGIATRGDTLEIATRLALQAAGVAPDAVGYTPLGSGNGTRAALQSGALPAVVISPAGVVDMQEQGLLKNVHQIASLAGNVHMPVAGFAMAAKVLYGDPALAKKMVRAIVKGARYEKTFKSETIAIAGIYQKTGANPRGNAVEYDYFMRSTTRDLTLPSDLLAADLAIRASLIGLPRESIPPIENVYDFSLARAVNAELDAARWKPAR
jgi:ABC-type nitrate/sulfonate/bicarbonate transport system substrate-binding protein